MGEYKPLFREGDFEGQIRGGVGALMSAGGKTKLKRSNDPDFNAFIPTSEDGDKGYLFTNWEDRPGGMSRVLIVKSDNGSWSIAENDFIMIDFGPVEGTWVNCFGSVSPWKTPLSSEELYFDDTSQWNKLEFEDYNSRATLARQLGCYPNPYDYGFNVEITEPTSHNPAPVKHLAMGRYSHENSVVMPDEKTVYLSDDGTGGVFFKSWLISRAISRPALSMLPK
jgi:uncharacterized protein